MNQMNHIDYLRLYRDSPEKVYASLETDGKYEGYIKIDSGSVAVWGCLYVSNTNVLVPKHVDRIGKVNPSTTKNITAKELMNLLNGQTHEDYALAATEGEYFQHSTVTDRVYDSILCELLFQVLERAEPYPD